MTMHVKTFLFFKCEAFRIRFCYLKYLNRRVELTFFPLSKLSVVTLTAELNTHNNLQLKQMRC